MGDDQTPGSMHGSSWQMATLIADVKTLMREVRDIGAGLKETVETVGKHDQWIAIQDDREKRKSRWLKVLGAFVVTFSATAAGSLVYLIVQVKG